MHIQDTGSQLRRFPAMELNCSNCDGVRKGHLERKPRTSPSIALSMMALKRILCNASRTYAPS